MELDEAINSRWQKQSRVFYLATASNGAQAIRGSSKDCYTFACLWVSSSGELVYDNQLVNATFHRDERLAKRQQTQFQNLAKEGNQYWQGYNYEVVQLKKITSKEVRLLKKLNRKGYEQMRQLAIQKATNTEGKELEQVK